MKQIPLTQNKFALVDDADFDWLSQWDWYAAWDGFNWYAQRTEYKPTQRTVKMHVALMRVSRVDHRDGDGLNNQRKNLRDATARQNRVNSRPRRTRACPFKGVDFRKRSWRARCDGQYFGDFQTATEAALAYDAAAIKSFGEFARLNFPIAKQQTQKQER